jgi:hypothetical protein
MDKGFPSSVTFKTLTLDLRCNIDAIAMITKFCTVVLSTDPGNGAIT